MAISYPTKTTADSLVAEFGSNIKGKVVLTTGVSPGGLGAYFVEALAQGGPKLLILAGRNPNKTQATADKIRESAPGVDTRVLTLDLASFASCKKAAATVNAYQENIDVLVNNAGIMAAPYAKTEDGHESQFQANHLGHFLFTNLVLPKVLAALGGGRVVCVTSDAYMLGGVRYLDADFHVRSHLRGSVRRAVRGPEADSVRQGGESYNPWAAYGASKTANILFAHELAARHGAKGLTAYSVHPGIIWTNLPNHLGGDDWAGMTQWAKQLGCELGWRELVSFEPNEGVARHVFASFGPELKGESAAFSFRP